MTCHYFIFKYNYNKLEEYKIGVLLAQKGEFGSSEQPIINAIQLATEEINQQDGFGGRKIKLVFEDLEEGGLDFKGLSEKLIRDQKVSVLFACWTSACRKEVKPVVEKYNSLMIYTNQYEGVEESSHMIYLGATPNQQLIPAVKWMMDHFGKRVYLVGSDYIYPHVSNKLAKLQISSLQGEIVGERYVPLKSHELNNLIKEIVETKPDFILNTLNGDANIDFFNSLLKMNNHPIPVMSLSLADGMVAKISPHYYSNMYSAWTYLSSSENERNKQFLDKYRLKYGTTEDLNDPAVTAYAAMYLLQQAIKSAPNIKPRVIRDKLLRQSSASPAGAIYIDPLNGHGWRTLYITNRASDGSHLLKWSSVAPIRPVVYPKLQTKLEWEFFTYKLYLNWDKSWGKIY